MAVQFSKAIEKIRAPYSLRSIRRTIQEVFRLSSNSQSNLRPALLHLDSQTFRAPRPVLQQDYPHGNTL
jgi:hypothetical protein